MRFLALIIIICYVVGLRKVKAEVFSDEKKAPKTTGADMKIFQKIQKKRSSAVPNHPRKVKRSKTEEAVLERTRPSGKACNYEALYSRGRPDRIGRRGDYEPIVPDGMVRVSCAYCGAENFIPGGTHDHYHCYFCWEKL